VSRFRFRLSRDVVRNRETYRRGFYGDEWVGDHHAFWMVESCDGELAGFCSAVRLANDATVFLSSAYVFRPFRGRGLQRAMIRHRTAWAKRGGAKAVITYTVEGNWPSAASLLKTGFRPYEPAWPWVGRAWYFQRAP